MGSWLRKAIIGVPALLILIQAVPYGRDHVNPRVVLEPKWASPETRAMAKRACFDCHSNETVWPWYSNVAPVSWLIRSDVTEGREELNFSEWRYGRRKGERPKEIRKALQEGEMPPFYYVLVHPEARLNAEQRKTLADALVALATR
jgi:Haem-binding domain